MFFDHTNILQTRLNRQCNMENADPALHRELDHIEYKFSRSQVLGFLTFDNLESKLTGHKQRDNIKKDVGNKIRVKKEASYVILSSSTCLHSSPPSICMCFNCSPT